MAIQTIPAAAAGGGVEPYYQKFTSSGTFTLPAGYGVSKPLLVNIQVIGGGGGGVGPTVRASSGVSLFSNAHGSYFGTSSTQNFVPSANRDYDISNLNAKGGGSGGIAATQMYLTSNLTITVGAAGAIGNVSIMNGRGLESNAASSNVYNSTNFSSTFSISGAGVGGTGGTTTAGSVSSAGGVGSLVLAGNISVTYTNGVVSGNNNNSTVIPVNAITVNTFNNSTGGAGGTPSGTQGDATPLLGTLAGGSGNTTSVFGSFGIGGKRGDSNTNTGVEGTGGGAYAISAPGAVILTWWE